MSLPTEVFCLFKKKHVFTQGRYLPSIWEKADRKTLFFIFVPFSRAGSIGPSSFVVLAGQTQQPVLDESLVGKKLPLKTIVKAELDSLLKLKHIFNSNDIQQWHFHIEDIILNLSVSICSLNESNSAYSTACLKGLFKAKEEHFFLKLWVCWPEISRQPNISPAKNEFIWDQQELQFTVCSQDDPHASPNMTVKGECFYREEKEIGRTMQ